MAEIDTNGIITIASITVAFYAFFANILFQRRDAFSKVLFIILIANTMTITYIIYDMLNSIISGYFQPEFTLSSLQISWYLAFVIVLFSFLNFFILDFERIHSHKAQIKYYLYIILIYSTIFIIFFAAIVYYIRFEFYVVFITIFFFMALILINLTKKATIKDSEKVEEKINITQISPTDEIRKAKDLLENGTITEEEFVKIKEKYLK